MAERFISQIIMFGGPFAIRGHAFCHGQTIIISQHDVLYSMIGTIYGGDRRQTFALPDLRGRAPVHFDDRPSSQYRYYLGQKTGGESHTLTEAEMPSHRHFVDINIQHPRSGLFASSRPADTNAGIDRYLAASGVSADGSNIPVQMYTSSVPAAQRVPIRVGQTVVESNLTNGRHKAITGDTEATGGGQPISILSPVLAINFQIVLDGRFPSRN